MSTYIITYDLSEKGQNYDCLHQKLQSYTTHWHAQQSVWFVETSESAAQIRDKLRPCLDNNDKLLVAKLSGEAAWFGYNQKVTSWLKGRLEPAR